MKPSYIFHAEDYLKTPAYSSTQLGYERSQIYTPIYYKLNSINSTLHQNNNLPSLVSMIGHDRLIDSLSNFGYNEQKKK